MKNQWKWAGILRKSKGVNILGCLKPWCAERVFRFAKSYVFRLENLTFCKVETRSANHVNTNRNHVLFYRNVKRLTLFICIYMVCWTWFLNSRKTGFPIEKLNILQSGNRVQQTMRNQMKISWHLGLFYEMAHHFYLFLQCLLNAFSPCKN